MPYPYKSIREWFSDEEKLGNVVRIYKWLAAELIESFEK